MGKHEPCTPKAIANRIKSKGLQKLRWYCQMCQKQCRDQNGFKCHMQSESHQRQLLLFADNSKSYMSEFNSVFKKGFLDILSRQYGTKRVHANKVYTEYIKDKDHIHMNSTSWHSLGGFVRFLGSAGIAKIDMTEKGWYIQYIDQEELKREARVQKKTKMDQDDEERISLLISKQANRALEQAECEGKLVESEYTELQKGEEDDKVEFAMPKVPPIKLAMATTAKPQVFKLAEKKKLMDEDSRSMASCSTTRPTTTKMSSLDEIRLEEERRKDVKNRKDYWLHPGIVVKVDQSHVETVIPAIGKHVLLINGAYRNTEAVLNTLNQNSFSVDVTLKEGPAMGRVLTNVKYEDVSKLAHL